MSTLILNAGSALARGAGALLSSGALRKAALSAATNIASRAINSVLDDSMLEGPRLADLRLQTSTEGALIPMVWGRARLSGQVIWAARFLESKTTRRTGGKGGGPRAADYNYSLSFAIGLCEGEILGLGRCWANGEPLNLSDYAYRLYMGGEDQEPDSLIEVVEGADHAPAFRGLAYIVFEDMPLDAFGDRLPQLSFEVLRRPKREGGERPLDQMIQAVDLIPASGEFAYATQIVFKQTAPGVSTPENARNAQGRADFLNALDILQMELPHCAFIWLTVGWFGDDLRCGVCAIKPGVETQTKATAPFTWSVAGLGRNSAHLVSQNERGAIYGGTPSDFSVMQAIQELKARGFQVGLYPFLFMDISPGNALPDPYGSSEQAAFPWRGRIACHPAPGLAGTPDATSAAESQVNAFFGVAEAGHFSALGGAVQFSGPQDWRYNRFILHQAALAQAAGGVDAFLIGSEMRSLTRIRGARNAYPAAAKLIALAGHARELLGGETKILYAADWSEYGAHSPGDGSGDLGFPLDALWAHPNIDAVGLDWYPPLSDWRGEGQNADGAEAQSIYDPDYLKARIEGGENFDWHYASDADRLNQNRTPITDGAYHKPWVYRAKDVRAWWSNAHYSRLGGVEQAAPSAWIPESKPIWLTELGCPAADKGANQPNVFYDPKSMESALPHFSSGRRDDVIQRRLLEAYLRYWDPGQGRNPNSSVYGAPMIDSSRIAIWCWDARPFPDFPGRPEVWGDAENWRLGHWISGRMGLAPLGDVVSELCRKAGFLHVNVAELDGLVTGFALSDYSSARQALAVLALAYGFELAPDGEGLAARRRDGVPVAILTADDFALETVNAQRFERIRHDPALAPIEARVRFYDSGNDYLLGAVSARREDGAQQGVMAIDAPLALDAGQAESIAWRALAEARAECDQIECALPRRLLRLTPGDIVDLDLGQGRMAFHVDHVTEGALRRAKLKRAADAPSLAPFGAEIGAGDERPVFTPPDFLLFDAPFADGLQDWRALAAIYADPWPGMMRIYAGANAQSLRLVGQADAPAAMGELTAPLPPGPIGRWQEDSKLRVRLRGAELHSASSFSVLNGANLLAVQSPLGGWELIQFRDALLAGRGEWILSGLLRGQSGTDDQGAVILPEGARVFVLDGRLARLDMSENERGVTLQWRVGPAGRDPYDVSYAVQEGSINGRALRPWSPGRLRAERLSGGDVRIAWVRRARWGGDGWDGLDPPLCEEFEAYEVNVLNAGQVKRRLTAMTASALYAAAEQIADFGALPQMLDVEVAQVSNRAGLGCKRRILLSVG